MKKNRLGPVLALYAGMPFLFVTIILRRQGVIHTEAGVDALRVSLYCFAGTAALIMPLFRIRHRRIMAIYGAVLLVAEYAASFLMGIFVHEELIPRLFNAHLYPQLTVGFYLLGKFLAGRSYEQTARSINVTIRLFISIFCVSHVLRIYEIFTAASVFSAGSLLFELYDILNFIPFFLSLAALKRKAEKVFTISKSGIFFQGRNVDDAFSAFHRGVLAFWAAYPRRSVTCGDIVAAGLLPSDGRNAVCDPSEVSCKASACSVYMSIYRKMNDLRKIMEALRIGSIATPPNKQDIRRSGWTPRLYSGVRLKVRIKAAAQAAVTAEDARRLAKPERRGAVIGNPHKPERRKEGLTKASGLVFAIFVSLAFAAEYRTFLPETGTGMLKHGIPTAAALAVFTGTALPFFLNSWRGCLRVLCPIFGVVGIGIVASSYYIGGIQTLFLAVKIFVIVTIVFLLNLRRFDGQDPMPGMRAAASRGVFWIVWFYVTALLIVKEPHVDSAAAVDVHFVLNAIILLNERILLILLVITMFLFLMYRPKIFILRGEGFFLNGLSLEKNITRPNEDLLRLFLYNRDNILRCSAIVRALYMAESKHCETDCKTSLCGPYQRIYKRVREVRKFLHTFELGTIFSPDKTAEAKNEGWKLYFFDDVYVRTDSNG